MNENSEIPPWLESCVAFAVWCLIVLYGVVAFLEQHAAEAERDWEDLAW